MYIFSSTSTVVFLRLYHLEGWGHAVHRVPMGYDVDRRLNEKNEIRIIKPL